ncbi:MAG TPA: sterol desaturase family protein [Kofleriaceae bacterium]|nr:sterol desaturase family protein [Kofleriaceae bacterium]
MLAIDALRYTIAAGAAFLAVRALAPRYRRRLIRGVLPERAQLRREIAYSASTIAIFAAVGTGVWYGADAGVLQLYDRVDAHGWLYFVLSIAVLVVAQDAYFYWTHRAMHHRRLFRIVHRVHHLSRNPSPWAAYAFAPIEAFVHAAFVPLATLAMPVHRIALFVFLAFMIVRNVIGHLGLELLPAGFIGRWPWTTTTTHHALHHHRPHGNYGLYFTWWDRLAGTTDPTYEATFAALTEPAVAE